SRGIVEQRVDADRAALAVDQDGGGVANVAMPEGSGALRLPAEADPRSTAVAKPDAVQALFAKESPHGLRGHGSALEPPVRRERAHDQRDAGRGMLAAD